MKKKYIFLLAMIMISLLMLNNLAMSSSVNEQASAMQSDQAKTNATKTEEVSGSGYFDVVFGNGNVSPKTPVIPSGPSSGTVGASYSYSTSTIDPNGYPVKYTFDWGDGTASTTALVNSGAKAGASHAWSKGGIDLVKAMATNSKGATSGWSSPLAVTISANNPVTPPNAPWPPSGPRSGVVGTSYTFYTLATDPNGNQVKYTFYWDDGTPNTQTEFVNSGTSASASHSWTTPGTYLIGAMATNSKGATSAWSQSTRVTIRTISSKRFIPTSRTYGSDTVSPIGPLPGLKGLHGLTGS